MKQKNTEFYVKRNTEIYAGWNKTEQQTGMGIELALHHDL